LKSKSSGPSLLDVAARDVAVILTVAITVTKVRTITVFLSVAVIFTEVRAIAAAVTVFMNTQPCC
jgi:hypothetical protein